jgi:hypothetical protein
VRDLEPAELKRWTGLNPMGCDFSGFDVPTTDSVTWDSPGAIVTVSLSVNMDGRTSSLSVDTMRGTWNREVHGLLVLMPTRRNPARQGSWGLSGLVMAHINREINGFTVHGRALEDDAERIIDLVRVIACNWISVEIDALKNLQSAIPGLCDREKEALHTTDVGSRACP